MKTLTRLPALLLATFVLAASAVAQDIRFSKDNLQEELESYLPVTEQQDFFSLTLKNPELDLLVQQQRISIRTKVMIQTVLGTVHQGSITVDGKLRYQRANHSFYVDDPRMTAFEFADIPDALKPQVQALVEQTLADAVTGYPLYRLSDKNFEEAMAKMMLHSISIQENAVVASLQPIT